MPKKGAKLGARLSTWPDMVRVWSSYGVMWKGVGCGGGWAMAMAMGVEVWTALVHVGPGRCFRERLEPSASDHLHSQHPSRPSRRARPRSDASPDPLSSRTRRPLPALARTRIAPPPPPPVDDAAPADPSQGRQHESSRTQPTHPRPHHSRRAPPATTAHSVAGTRQGPLRASSAAASCPRLRPPPPRVLLRFSAPASDPRPKSLRRRACGCECAASPSSELCGSD